MNYDLMSFYHIILQNIVSPEDVLNKIAMLSVQMGRLVDCTGLSGYRNGHFLMSGVCTLICAARIELFEFHLPAGLNSCPVAPADDRARHGISLAYLSGTLVVRILDQILVHGNALLEALESEPSWCF